MLICSFCKQTFFANPKYNTVLLKTFFLRKLKKMTNIFNEWQLKWNLTDMQQKSIHYTIAGNDFKQFGKKTFLHVWTLNSDFCFQIFEPWHLQLWQSSMYVHLDRWNRRKSSCQDQNYKLCAQSPWR